MDSRDSPGPWLDYRARAGLDSQLDRGPERGPPTGVPGRPRFQAAAGENLQILGGDSKELRLWSLTWFKSQA